MTSLVSLNTCGWRFKAVRKIMAKRVIQKVYSDWQYTTTRVMGYRPAVILFLLLGWGGVDLKTSVRDKRDKAIILESFVAIFT